MVTVEEEATGSTPPTPAQAPAPASAVNTPAASTVVDHDNLADIIVRRTSDSASAVRKTALQV